MMKNILSNVFIMVPVLFVNTLSQPLFIDQTAAFGLTDIFTEGSTIAPCDFDRDGDIDIYVAIEIGANRLYRNMGAAADYTYQQVAAQLHLDDESSSRHAAWGDYDNDGYVDLFVSNGARPGKLYRNTGPAHDFIFEDVSTRVGLQPDGVARCAAWADYNNDGFLDLYVVNDNEANRLYENMGEAAGYAFQQVAPARGVDDDGMGRHAAWADFD
ncbi:VCBS repeat-containing protein, partial [candidate division KSB1 bacterium]|nr:VCBS repeat-containing protein [candidate division KSB1 bacterium]